MAAGDAAVRESTVSSKGKHNDNTNRERFYIGLHDTDDSDG